MNWHSLNIDEVYEKTGSGPGGLTADKAAERLIAFGPNQLQEGKKNSVFRLLVSQFKDLLIWILLAAALVSGLIGEMTDTVVILVIVLLNGILGFTQEFRAQKAMLALRKMAVGDATILRDGRTCLIPATSVVPGDIVYLEAGDAVPADLRVTESLQLKIDEAALTGESEPVQKIPGAIKDETLPVADRKNLAFKGTFVAAGRGTGVVVGTGMQTELGRIASLLEEKETGTPLQNRMAAFGKKLSLLVLLLCVLFFISGWLRNEDLLQLALTSISIAVAAIPEALPAVITISLALAAKKMIRFHCLIRKLSAVETLGSVSYICTDKTGTLTQNKLLVEEIFVDGKQYRLKEWPHLPKEDNVLLLLHAFALNNDVVYDAKKTKGDPTEAALKEVAAGEKIDAGAWPRVAEMAFDANRKLMTTFHPYGDGFISFTKGAPDLLLEKCVNVHPPAVSRQIDQMALSGLRVLGFGYRRWDGLPEDPQSLLNENELQFLGLAGMIDPPRDEVFAAIEESRSAGIVPVMITGDHPLTATTIARRIGIINGPSDLVVTGRQLAQWSRERLLQSVEHIRVYARVSPEQKLQIVSTLQEKGHYVAMTGDGVNDAPSLRRANVGIAMGLTGTDVAKEAAHMILLDDNFSTIVKAVREGRRVYDNILKFISYLMTTNSGELWLLLLGPLLGLPIALRPIHILWMNLVTDGLPALMLSFEKAEKDVMLRPPRPPRESIFDNGRGFDMLWVGILMAGVCLAAQGVSIRLGLHWQTIVFNLLCISQMAHLLAVRSPHRSLFALGIFSNLPLVGAVLLTLLLQLAVTYIPGLHPIFKTQSLTFPEFAAVGAASSVVFIAVELKKALSRQGNRSTGKETAG